MVGFSRVPMATVRAQPGGMVRGQVSPLAHPLRRDLGQRYVTRSPTRPSTSAKWSKTMTFPHFLPRNIALFPCPIARAFNLVLALRRGWTRPPSRAPSEGILLFALPPRTTPTSVGRSRAGAVSGMWTTSRKCGGGFASFDRQDSHVIRVRWTSDRIDTCYTCYWVCHVLLRYTRKAESH